MIDGSWIEQRAGGRALGAEGVQLGGGGGGGGEEGRAAGEAVVEGVGVIVDLDVWDGFVVVGVEGHGLAGRGGRCCGAGRARLLVTAQRGGKVQSKAGKGLREGANEGEES